MQGEGKKGTQKDQLVIPITQPHLDCSMPSLGGLSVAVISPRILQIRASQPLPPDPGRG